MLTKDHLKVISEDPRAFLNQSYKTQERIRIKEHRIRQLKELSVQITSTIKPVSTYTGPGDKIADCAINIVDLSREIEDEIRSLAEAQELVSESIKLLVPDVVQRSIMEARYLVGMRWEEIAYEYHYAYRWVLRLHRRGLNAMKNTAEEMLNGEIHT